MPTIDLNTTRIKVGDFTFNALKDTLQGNILKSHGRERAAHVFLRFNPGREAAARQFLASLDITSVAAHEEHKLAHAAGKEQVATFLYLTVTGYGYLGIGQELWPADLKFQGGMQDSAEQLSDTPESWEESFRQEIHAMIIIASSGQPEELNLELGKLTNLLTNEDLGTVLTVEWGLGLKQKVNGQFTGNHIEHFNYVDGISQPLFFEENIDQQNWNPFQPLGLVLVPEPINDHDLTYGSYLVFRKLEQNVQQFKKAELATATDLGLSDRELAGAMVIGRFENGSPVTVSKQDDHALENNFSYGADQAGARCPFHAHIRKTNPRGETESLGLSKHGREAAHLIARRGITYGERKVHPSDVPDGDFDSLPDHGVGLLFMCFQADIEQQFEFIQQSWASNNDFIVPKTGLDIVIGQGKQVIPHQYATKYGDPFSIKPSKVMMQSFVQMKGGEYFYAPSLTFIRKLA